MEGDWVKANPLTTDKTDGSIVLNSSEIKKHVSLKKCGGTVWKMQANILAEAGWCDKYDQRSSGKLPVLPR